MSSVKGYSLKYNIYLHFVFFFYIVHWMSINQLLKLNTEKTELIVISSSRQAQPIFPALSFGSDRIFPSDSVRNIGVTFDRTLSMSPHINMFVNFHFIYGKLHV